MPNQDNFNSYSDRLRAANTTMIARYAYWTDYMLTVTFKEVSPGQQPSEAQVHAQLRHMQCTLNATTWGNRSKFNEKCRIVFIPIIEGARTSTRIHAHVLLGNIGNKSRVNEYVQNYIPRSRWLAPRFDLSDVYDADGVALYLAKETGRVNLDAVAWQLASIPKPLLPR